MSLCASCGTDLSIGCDHFHSTDYAGQQEKIIEVSEAAARANITAPHSPPAFMASSSDKVEAAAEKKVAPRSTSSDEYVPGKRDYTVPPAAGASQRGPSVIMSHGPSGPVGQTGATGAPGRDGVSPSVNEVIDAATSAMESRLAKFEANVGNILEKALRDSGVTDENNKAILVPGPEGKPGRSIVGPAGKDGLSIQGDRGADGVSIKGEPGRDGRDGSIVEATKAAKEYVQREMSELTLSMREMVVGVLREKKFIDANGNVIRGEQGPQGAPGVRGPAGDLSACERLIETKLAAFREELKRQGIGQ